MCENRPEQIVASLKLLKKPKNEAEKYFAKLQSGIADDDMEYVSDQEAGQKDTQKDESEPDEVVQEEEEQIVEDLTDTRDVTEVHFVDNWPKRFQQANYTQEQQRVITLALSKRDEWLEINKMTDWTNQETSEITVDYRISERGHNTMRASRVLPYKVMDVFKTLNAGYLRQSFDVNISKTQTLQRICCNCTLIYQASKKIMIVSPRDFVLVNFVHKVSALANLVPQWRHTDHSVF